MSLDDALFLVDRGGTNYHVKGSEIGDKMVADDIVLVQRNKKRYKATYNGADWGKIKDGDLILAWDGSNPRTVKGETFKTLFGAIHLGDVTGSITSSNQSPTVNSIIYYSASTQSSTNAPFDNTAFTYEWSIPAFMEFTASSNHEGEVAPDGTVIHSGYSAAVKAVRKGIGAVRVSISIRNPNKYTMDTPEPIVFTKSVTVS